MPRGRPKGSKNKSSKSKATASQLAALTKARKVRAKQIKYFPALPPGGFKALSTPARIAATQAAYAKFSKKMISSAKPRKLRVSAVPTSTLVITSVPKTRKPRKPRNTSFNSVSSVGRAAMISALTNTLNYKRPIGPRRKATDKQLAALARARAARAGRGGNGGQINTIPILSRAELMV
jgi:hypothetical protein